MVYLYYISCLKYAILVGNPRKCSNEDVQRIVHHVSVYKEEKKQEQEKKKERKKKKRTHVKPISYFEDGTSFFFYTQWYKFLFLYPNTVHKMLFLVLVVVFVVVVAAAVVESYTYRPAEREGERERET